MRIYLADLAHTQSVDDRSLTVPLNIGYVAAFAKAQLGDAVEIRLFKHPEQLLAAVHEAPPDVVGFTNYGWNEQINRVIGSHIRACRPNALIVAGGPNMDDSADRRLAFLQRHAYLDFLVVDAGEAPFTELLSWWQGGRDIADLPNNLVWRDGDSVRATPETPLTKDVGPIPSPYLTGLLDEFLAAGMIPLFESNRGCPFRCTFCAWGAASKNLVRKLDVDVTLAEIEYVGVRSEARNWIFCDANFGILKRDVDIALAIRKNHDARGLPVKCHIWLAKNASERNLEIGSILGDMIVPVMAVQSLSDEALQHVKRDNIKKSTYVDYQRKFHAMGSRTYSDLIVPLPGETLDSHVDALRKLMEFGVDVIQSHNLRLLAGTAINSAETRERFGFKTRCRLIHGDAGEYRTPDGTVLRAFEYEESLRATSTLSEEELFFLRKLHFLVDFSWNTDAYKPLLKAGLRHGVNPIDVLLDLLAMGEAQPADSPIGRFWADFDRASRAEWFDDGAAIERHFADEGNFARLIGQEFEKLNILFSVLLLQRCKSDFDAALHRVLEARLPGELLASLAPYCFALFPPMDAPAAGSVAVPANLADLVADGEGAVKVAAPVVVTLAESPRRAEVCAILADLQGKTLSKILNTQGIVLRDLKLTAVAA